MKNHLTLVPFQGGRPVFWPFLWFSLSCSTATLLYPCGKVCGCCTGSMLSVCLLLSLAFSQSLLGLLSPVLTFPVPALTSTLKFSFLFTGKLTPSLPQENPTWFTAVGNWEKALLRSEGEDLNKLETNPRDSVQCQGKDVVLLGAEHLCLALVQEFILGTWIALNGGIF